MDIFNYNREAWNREVDKGNEWTRPVSHEVIQAARQGRWQIILTPTKPVPSAWYPPLQGADVLCLASGGGQQGPVLAAVGAHVTVLDASESQLAQDRLVAEREGLEIRTVQGNMEDLSMLPDASFDLIVHPVSNVFTPNVCNVWRGAYRVLRKGGALLSGFDNPINHIFDHELAKQQILQVKYALPYSDEKDLDGEERQEYFSWGIPLEYSHTLEEQIGGQIEAGFVIAGFYEDGYPPAANDLMTRYYPPFLATRALKP